MAGDDAIDGDVSLMQEIDDLACPFFAFFEEGSLFILQAGILP
jgi:hypothetical protein